MKSALKPVTVKGGKRTNAAQGYWWCQSFK